MNEARRGDGNTDGPRVDENEVRPGDAQEESGTRRVGDARREHEEDRRQREDELGTSWPSVVIGWLASLGALLILSGIVSGIVGAIFGAAGSQALLSGGTAALVGLLITLLLAFLIGGYAAGRMAARSGLKHGLLVPLLNLLVVIVLAVVGGLVGVSFIDQLGGIALPQEAQQQAPQNVGTILSISGALALLFPFVGGAIGGALGARTGRRRP
jgi:amino acid transporter